MRTRLDQIIDIKNEEPVIKDNIPSKFYQKGIYQWWHNLYGCVYVGISAVNTKKKNDGMPMRALHHVRKLLGKEKGNTQPTKKWRSFSKIFLSFNHQYDEIEVVYDNHPSKSKDELKKIEKQLIENLNPICNS